MFGSLLREEKGLMGDSNAFVALEERMSQRMAPSCDWTDMGSDAHFVQFFESDSFIVDGVSEYLWHGLRNGETCIAVATVDHLRGIGEAIEKFSADVKTSTGKYIALDACDTLNCISTNGEPDQEKFNDVIGDLIRKAEHGGRGVRVFGEMVGILCSKLNYDAAVKLEGFWNELKKDHAFSLFCGYSINDLTRTGASTMSVICSGHTNVIPTESYSSLVGTKDRLRHIAMLQQRNKELEAEVRELENRIAAKQSQAPDLVPAAA